MGTPIINILKRKGDWVITIDRSATVYQAIERMVNNNVGAIIITDQGNPCGIFTERDYLRRIALQGRTSRETIVQDVMTEQIFCVDTHYTVEECLAIMSDKKIRHLPVMRGDHLAGIISIGDCVKELSADAEVRIHSLTSYITGAYPG